MLGGLWRCKLEARQKHLETCRKRSEEAMKDDKRMKNAERGVVAFLESEVSRADAKRKKIEEENKKVEEHDVEMRGDGHRGNGSSSSWINPVVEPSPDATASEAAKRPRDDAELDDEDMQENKRIAIDNVNIFAVNDDIEEEEMIGETKELEWAEDDVNGKELDIELVRKARAEEMQFIKGIPLYEEKDVSESWKVTGAAPISAKWVDTDKGRGEIIDIRSRWVARDFKVKGDRDREDLFAAMPPLEAKKVLFKMAAMRMSRSRWGKKSRKLLFIDVRKAHLNGVCEEDVYVELLLEAGAPGKCGKLLRWLYGMRGAAQAWEKD